MDLSRLSSADKVILGAALALFITLFLPWFSVDVGGGVVDASGSASGFDAGGFLFAIVPLLIAIVMAAQIAIDRFSPGTTLPNPPVPWGQVHLILGAIALALIVLKFLIGEDAGVGDAAGVDVSRSWGIFLSILAAAALTFGGFQKRGEGDTVASRPTGGTTAPPR